MMERSCDCHGDIYAQHLCCRQVTSCFDFKQTAIQSCSDFS
jgi:hypothetical protein